MFALQEQFGLKLEPVVAALAVIERHRPGGAPVVLHEPSTIARA